LYLLSLPIVSLTFVSSLTGPILKGNLVLACAFMHVWGRYKKERFGFEGFYIEGKECEEDSNLGEVVKM
jgi:hypothetical protein